MLRWIVWLMVDEGRQMVHLNLSLVFWLQYYAGIVQAGRRLFENATRDNKMNIRERHDDRLC